MSDTPVTLHGSSGPASDGFANPPTSKKPWRAPLIIQSEYANSALKTPFPTDTPGLISAPNFGPS